MIINKKIKELKLNESKTSKLWGKEKNKTYISEEGYCYEKTNTEGKWIWKKKGTKSKASKK